MPQLSNISQMTEMYLSHPSSDEPDLNASNESLINQKQQKDGQILLPKPCRCGINSGGNPNFICCQFDRCQCTKGTVNAQKDASVSNTNVLNQKVLLLKKLK
jgi:hypothetical protein